MKLSDQNIYNESILKEDDIRILINSKQSKKSQFQKNDNEILNFIIILSIVFITGILKDYDITFFPLFWKQNFQSNGEEMIFFMINCLQFSIIFMLPIQTQLLQILGKKSYIQFGIVLVILSNFGISLISIQQNINQAQLLGIFCKFIQGIGICIIQTSLYSIISYSFENKKSQYIRLANSTMILGEILGPIIGSFFNNYFGFAKQYQILNIILLILLIQIFQYLPNKNSILVQENFQQQKLTIQFYQKIMCTREIYMDILAICLCEFLSKIHIAFYPYVLQQKFNLNSEAIGFLYLCKNLSFIFTTFAFSWMNLPPKFSHLIGLFILTFSLPLIGYQQYFYLNESIQIIFLGFLLQGIGSAFIMSTAMGNIIDTFQYKFNILPQLQYKIYSNFCDTISNLLEGLQAISFIVGSYTGFILFQNYQINQTFFFLFIFGLGFSMVFLFKDCKFQPYLDHRNMQIQILKNHSQDIKFIVDTI